MSEPMSLTPQQRAAVEHGTTPLRIIAGAGSGKTTVMARRIVHLVDNGTRPDQVLGLTFSNKAAANLRAKVRDALGPGSDVKVATYHGFGASLVEEHALELGLPEHPQVLDGARAWQLALDAFDELSFRARKTGNPTLIVSDALTLASRAADHLVDIQTVAADCEAIMADTTLIPAARDKAAGRRELCNLVEAYQARKLRNGLIDYDDQIRFAVKLLEQDPDLAASLHERWPVVLLDEYQDTNFAQRRLLELLCPPGSCITAVGDDMQAIYAFRGAHVQNIFDFPGHFGTAEAPCTTISLETCFRSGPSIVAIANHVQAEVPTAQPKVLVPRDDAAPSRIECFQAADDAAEAEGIARRIVAAAAAGTPWHEIAVLCRKRKIMPTIAHSLALAGVPCEIVGIGGLLTRPEVMDALAWLEVITLDEPTVALLRILRGPRYRLGMRDLAAMARAARGDDPDASRKRIDLLAAVTSADGVPDLSPEAWARAKEVVARRDRLRAAERRCTLPELLEEVLIEAGSWRVVDAAGHENLLRLLDLAARFEPAPGEHAVRAFLEWAALRLESGDEPAEATASAADAVQVMTVHQAKGLEFDVVVVAGLAGSLNRTTSIFPDERTAENPVTQQNVLPYWVRPDNEGFERPPRDKAEEAAIAQHGRDRRRDEEHRLLYVSLTRARHLLVCSTGQWYPGPGKPQGVSDFYRLVRDRIDLVQETAAEPVTDHDPGVAAKERRAAAARRAAELAAGDASATSGTGRRTPDAAQGSLLTIDVGRTVGTSPQRPLPAALSASAIVSFARCPRQLEWTSVRPMPRRSSVAARLGDEVHRWIESLAGSHLPLDVDPVDGDDDAWLPADTGSAERGASGAGATPTMSLDDRRDGLRAAFLGTPYASRVPARVEAPFAITVAGSVLRGRIDAVYADDGRTEVVDFKTGAEPHPDDRSSGVQLDLYGLVAVRILGVDPAALTTSYCYLRSDGSHVIRQTPWDAARVVAVEDRLEQLLAAIHARRFDPTPGAWCRGCDFSSFCTAADRAAATSAGGA